MKSRAQADVPTVEETRERYINSLSVSALKVELTKVGVKFTGSKKKEYYVGLALDSAIVVPGSSPDMGGTSGSGSGVTTGASSSAATGPPSITVVGSHHPLSETTAEDGKHGTSGLSASSRALGADGIGLKSAAAASGAQPPPNQTLVMPLFETTAEDGKDGISGLSGGGSSLNKDGTQIDKESTSSDASCALGSDGNAPKSAAAASGSQPPSNQASVMPTTDTTAEDGKDATSGLSAGESFPAKDGTQIAEETTSVADVRARGADGFAPKSAAAASSARPPSNQASVMHTTDTTAEDGKDATSGLSAGESFPAKDGTQIAEETTSVADVRARGADGFAPKSAAAASSAQPPSNQASVTPTTDTTAEDGKDATSALSAGESSPAKDGTQIAEETSSVADVRVMGADGFALKSAAAASGLQPPSMIPITETTAEDGKDATSGLSAGESSSAKDGTQIAEETTSVEDVRALGANGFAPRSAAAASGAQPPLNQASVINTETTAEDGKDGTCGSDSGSTAAHAGLQPPCGTASVGASKAFTLSAGDIVDIHGWSPIGEYQFSRCTILLICDHPMIEENLLIWYERTLQFDIGSPSSMVDEEELSFPLEQGKLVSPLISECICNLNY